MKATNDSTGITAAYLARASGTELDEIFRKSPPGPTPTGRTRGTAILFAGSALTAPLAAIARWFWWKGKVFAPATDDLKNLVTPIGVPLIRALVYQDESWFSPGPAIIIDYKKTSLVARAIRDEIREAAPGVYLGQVFWGKKRIAHFMLETGGA
jgi:hypothetical protein